MRLSPRETDKLALHAVGTLAQRRLARGCRLNHVEATALLCTVLLELVRDGRHSVAQLMELGRRVLGRRHVLAAVWHTLGEVQLEATFQDGTKLVTVHQPLSTDDGDIQLALYGSFLPLPAADCFPPVDYAMLVPAMAPGAVVVAVTGVAAAARVTDSTTTATDSTTTATDSATTATDSATTATDSATSAITSTMEATTLTSTTPTTPTADVQHGRILINAGRELAAVRVTNDGDRPVQVGSHYHFAETNPKLRFDRVRTRGMRLNIAAGTAVRFEPGESKVVTLVALAGRRIVTGGNGLAAFATGPDYIARGFAHEDQLVGSLPAPKPFFIPRSVYAQAYGPTVGDLVRLGDTELWLEVERDASIYGEECVFGGGKVIREGMGQSNSASDADALDLVITNAVVIDHTGIFKCDIGIKSGLICGIGKAGNPDIMDGVTPGMIIGATTEVLAAEGKIITAGAIDTHIHFICPQLCTEALSSGITTLIGGGTGPNTGTNATTCTPGSSHIRMMLQATDDMPLNFGFTGKGNSANAEALEEQICAGAVGLKLHEDWGSTPVAIDTCLSVCEKHDVQATLHTDTLNESGFVESSIAAFKGRTIHAYHCEGAGGGHAPDIISVCSHPNVIPSSTNPTRPYTVNTLEEHLDMLMVCHHLDKSIPEDIAFAESRIRGETIGAEDILHDLGAISVISSDSQAMGRVGEVICRTWQTADKMKKMRGELRVDGTYASSPVSSSISRKNDNFRIKRYISKHTINPAIAHGVSHVVGSVETGKLADLVLWDPKFFGAKPEIVLKGGTIVWAQMGDANASIPTPQPVIGREMFGARAGAIRRGGKESPGRWANSVCFVSKIALESGTVATYGLGKRVEAVRGCRGLTKKDMRWNSLLPTISVDPETYEVIVDGQSCQMAPASTVPLSTSYFLF